MGPRNPHRGNAKWGIRRVPTNAMPTPAAPPNNESKMLSVRAAHQLGQLGTSAILNDICAAAHAERISMRLQHWPDDQQHNPETIIRI